MADEARPGDAVETPGEGAVSEGGAVLGRIDLVRQVSRRLFGALVTLLLVLVVVLSIDKWLGEGYSLLPVIVVLAGATGGFVGLQRRLKQITDDDLSLIATSWLQTVLSPLVGGILALLLYIVFLSGLVAGDLFPRFEADLTDRQKAIIKAEKKLGEEATTLIEEAQKVGSQAPDFAAKAGEVAKDAKKLVEDAVTIAKEDDAKAQRQAGKKWLVLLDVHGVAFHDYAKLLFWAFLAGFSEKFVVNILGQFEKRAGLTAGG